MNKVKYEVTIDEDLEELIPGFMENRKQDIQNLYKAVESGDCDQVRSIGHNLKGVGGGYGFMKITEFGAVLEELGKKNDIDATRKYVNELADYIDNIHIIYE